MVVVRAYAILDHIYVEASCVGHAGESPAGHLLFREHIAVGSGDFQDIADVLALGLVRAARLDLEEGIGWTDDCSASL